MTVKKKIQKENKGPLLKKRKNGRKYGTGIG